MDWQAFRLSFLLAGMTAACLLPAALPLARWLAYSQRRRRLLLEAAVALPLILPPTVLGYYLLVVMGTASPLGALYADLFGAPLAFSFTGLLVASIVFNLPFAVLPMQRAFAGIPPDLLDAARTCGLSRWRTLWRIELPLAWPGIMTALVMTAAHTLGEFGVVLMVGGNIPGETRTIAIAIYDRVQSFDMAAAGLMSAALLLASLVALLVSAWLGGGVQPGGGRR